MTYQTENKLDESWQTTPGSNTTRSFTGSSYEDLALSGVPSLGYDSFSCEATDETGMSLGWLVVDTMINGRSHGGIRIAPDVSLAELRILARRMTLKFGFLGLPGGGAKAGIIGDPEAPPQQRQALLRRFAVTLAPLLQSGCYQPAHDLGTGNSEIEDMLTFVGVQRSRREPSRLLAGFYTGLTVITGAQVAVQHRKLKLAGLRVALQGFGKVGAAVAQGLVEREARMVAISTSQGALYHPQGLPVKELLRLSQQVGSELVHVYKEAELIPKEDLLTLPVDLLCPCATSESIHTGNAKQVQAGIISPGANYPVTLEAEQILQNRGILCLPDFVTNSGGVLGGTMTFAGLDSKTIQQLIEEKLAPRIAALIQSAEKRGALISLIAQQEAMQRFLKIKRQTEQSGFLGGLFQRGLVLYRRGLIPGFWVKGLASRYFAAKLQ
ncbi:MAG TPA: Glu/Leu/Phe/Val dehydrogenase dimerization domain-containing protein [Candidatus Limnocylindrales bacterium]|nr:Glu/Leu/Phe/Val dehydrogenase dimerization domain-containing protein [Candidatus Limnocylindrales bacterium]